MHKNITVIAGDGIGPEVTAQSIAVLNTIATRFGHTFTYDYRLMGACAIDETGDPLPEDTIQSCLESDAVDRKSTRLNSSHSTLSRMPSSA